MATGVCTQTVQSKRRDMCLSTEPSQSVSVDEAQPFIIIIIQISWLIYQSMSISHRHAWPTDQTYGSRSGVILFAYVQRSYLLTGHKRVFCCECDLSNTSNYKHYAKRIQLNHLWAWDSVSDDHSLDDRLDKLSTQEISLSDIWFGPMATNKGSYSDMGRELLVGVNKTTFYHDFVAMYHQRSSLVLGLIRENVCGLTTTCFVLTWNKGQDLIKLIERMARSCSENLMV